jgi:hypothetical protein
VVFRKTEHELCEEGKGDLSEWFSSAAGYVGPGHNPGNVPHPFFLSELVGRPFHQTFLTQAVREGRLKARRSGRYVLIWPQDYIDFLNSFPSAADSRAHREKVSA